MEDIMIDAKEKSHMIVGTRGCGKTTMNMAYHLAWFESFEKGIAVSLSRGYELLTALYKQMEE